MKLLFSPGLAALRPIALGLVAASLTALGLTGLVAVSPASAQGRVVCGARDALVAALARAYGELPRVRALTAGGALLEVFVAPGGATWIIVITAPDGRSCIASAGEAWLPVKQREPGRQAFGGGASRRGGRLGSSPFRSE